MTALSCTIERTGRRMQVRMPYKHIYVAKYRIINDDATDGHLTVYQSAQTVGPHNLPAPFAAYSFLGDTDLSAQAREYELEQHETNKQTWWSATVTWRQGEPGEPTPDDLDDPLDRPPKYWIEYNRETYNVLKDKSGTAIVNTASQPYPEPIVRTYTRPVLAIKRNYASLDAIWTLNQTYENTINSDTFLSQAPKTWRYAMTQTNESREENGTEYWEGITRIEYKASTWVETKREEGWKHFRDPPDKTLITPIDGDGVAFGEPVLLGSSGDRLADGGTPFYRDWEVDDAVAYSPLIA